MKFALQSFITETLYQIWRHLGQKLNTATLRGCRPKWKFSTFTPDPNLHDPRFTPPQIYKRKTKPQFYTKPKFTKSQIYTVPKLQHQNLHQIRPNISFKGKDNLIMPHNFVFFKINNSLRFVFLLFFCTFV